MNNISYITQRVKDDLANNQAVIVIVQAKQRKQITEELSTYNFDIEEVKNKGQIKFLDAGLFLSNFILDNERLDTQSLNTYLSHTIKNSKLYFDHVLVIDGMMDLLLKRGKHESAVLLEKRLHDIASQQESSVFIYDSGIPVVVVCAEENSESSIRTAIENSVMNGLETAGNTLENLAKPSTTELKSFSSPI
ncbi:MEDS domain-containing protein [Nitrosomonas ureae]|uniref:DcmR-like sensory protein n=1 Tax=Nitrosomonas ureae TaxID=44577 RepID=A0A2T5IHB0_9PROT|nr:MEDS domain-containing protein [Nitrosomonas ureae]PTQ83206.1 DcmR-like sensory protein [Nitrosomonas ureae]